MPTGLFDDLVPKKPSAAAPASGTGLFDDLVPGNAPSASPGLLPASIDGVLGGIQNDAGALPPELGAQVARALGDGGAYDIAVPTRVHTGPTSRGGARHPKPTPPDYSDAFAPEHGALGDIAGRAFLGRAPDILANAVELPATVNDAVAHAIGVQPGFLDSFRSLANLVRGVSYTRDYDAAGAGLPSVSGHDLVQALNPRSGVALGDRASAVAHFIPETLVSSAPDMAATLDPATLAGYIGSRTNQVANNRAANEGRDAPALGDLAIAAPAATIESLLERFTTMRLLPHGTTLATPGAREAVVRIAKELGIQSSLGGTEEVVPYLAEQAHTDNPATAEGALEQFLGGALAEGTLGTGVQGIKELAASRRAGPVVSSDSNSPPAPQPAPPSAPPDATARLSSPNATAPVAGQISTPTAQDAPAAAAPPPEIAREGEAAPVAGVAPVGDGATVSAPRDLGAITPEISKAIRRESAPIRLETGDADFGETHIEEAHGEEIRKAGFNSAREFVADVTSHFEQIRKGREGRLLLVRPVDRTGRVAVVQLTPQEDGAAYSVTTAYLMRMGSVEKNELLWSRAPTDPTDPGNQPTFAGIPATKAEPGAPSAAAESTSSVPPPTPPSNLANAPIQLPAEDQPAVSAPVEPAPAPANVQPETATSPAANEPRLPVTSTKNAVTHAEREAEGREPVLRELAQTNQSTLHRARETLASNPSRGAEVVERLRNEGTRAISVDDEAVLLVEKTRLRNERDAAAARASDPAASEEARAVAKREFDAAEAKINEMDQATFASGREWGRLGQFRQRMLREDFSFEALERKERAREGRPLTMPELAKLKQFAERIQNLEAERANLHQQLADAHATAGSAQTYRDLVKQMASEFRAEPKGAPRLQKLRANAEESRAALRKMLGRTNAGVDPTAFYHLARIGAYHLANGFVKLAEWTSQMRAELGQKLFGEVEPALPDVFRAAQALGKQATVKSPADVLATINPAQPTHKDVVELARAHILAGVKGEGPVMQAVHADLVGKGAEISEREVRQLFADYGRVVYPSKDADKVALRELRALVQLQESIDRLQEGADALKSGPQRDKATAAVRDKRKQLDKLLRAREHAAGPSEEQLAAYRQARVQNLRDQIAALEKQIATGERPVKPQAKDAGPEVEQLTAERDALRRQLEAIDHPPLSPEERYQRGRSASLKKQLADVQARLAAGDYSHAAKREPRALNERNTELQLQLAKVKAEFAQHQFEADMAKRHPVRKILGGVAEGMNLARAILTSFDLSAVLRQGGVLALAHPARASTSIAPMLKAFATEKGEFRANEEIARRENAPLYKRFGLELTEDAGHSLSKMEEAYMSRWIQKIPTAVGGGLVRGSARAFTTFMNKLRADSFDALYYALTSGGPVTDKEGQAIANFVNVATGRGHIGSKSQAAVGLNTVFFAPRLVASRFNLLAGQPLYGGSNRTRRLIATEYARFLTGAAVVFALGAMAADKDDEPIASLDPRSADFLKMRFGNTYIDPMAGLGQVTTFLSRELSGEKRTTGSDLVPGKVVPLRTDYTLGDLQGKEHPKAKFGGEDGFDVLARFARTKLAPVPGAIVNTLTGEDVVGNPVTPTQTLTNNVMPMSLQNIGDIMTDNGVPKGTAFEMLNLLGMGVQYRAPRHTSDEELDTFKNLPIEDKLAAFEAASEQDRTDRNLRQIILDSDWAEAVDKLPKAREREALAQLERVRQSFDPATRRVVSEQGPDGQYHEVPPKTYPAPEEQLATYRAKAKIGKLERELRGAFPSGGLKFVNDQIAKHRDVLGPDVYADTELDDKGNEKLVLHGMKARVDELAGKAAP